MEIATLDFLDFASGQEEGLWEADCPELNPTHCNFMALHAQFFDRVKPRVSMAFGYPIILEAQLMALARDKRALRTELELLQRRKIVRAFNLDLPRFPAERYFVLDGDYVDHLRIIGRPVVRRFLSEIAVRHRARAIRKDALIDAGFTEADIRELIAAECLLLKTGSMYQLAMPSSGAIIASVADARQKLVASLAHLPSQMAERAQVERRTFDGSVFYAEFHVQELIGLGVLEVVSVQGQPDQLRLVYDPYSGKR